VWDLVINLKVLNMGHFEKLVDDLRREQLARRPVLFVKSLGPNVEALKRKATGILNKAFGDYKAGKITGLELTKIENAVGKIQWPADKRGRR